MLVSSDPAPGVLVPLTGNLGVGWDFPPPRPKELGAGGDSNPGTDPEEHQPRRTHCVTSQREQQEPRVPVQAGRAVPGPREGAVLHADAVLPAGCRADKASSLSCSCLASSSLTPLSRKVLPREAVGSLSH